MKSMLTTALAGLMLLGTISALATPNQSKVAYATDGPVPLCDPMTTPNCPSPMAKAKTSTDGPVPLCDPMTTPNCPSPMLKAK